MTGPESVRGDGRAAERSGSLCMSNTLKGRLRWSHRAGAGLGTRAGRPPVVMWARMPISEVISVGRAAPAAIRVR